MYWSILGENLILKSFAVKVAAPEMCVNINAAKHKYSTKF